MYDTYTVDSGAAAGAIFVFLLVAIGVGLIFGFVARSIGRSKNRADSWFWAGFLLGVIGLIWVAVMPVLQPGQPGYIERRQHA